MSSHNTVAVGPGGKEDYRKLLVDTMGRLKTLVEGTISVGTASAPADYDSASVSYPDAVTEVYTYSKAAVVIKTVTITYSSAAKSTISGWTIT